jgi:transposase
VRSMLLGIIGEARNRLEHLREPALRAVADHAMAAAQASLKEVDAGIAAIITEDDAMARKARIVRSMLGAGPILTSNLLARMPELGSIGRRQAASLSGVAPADRQSGKARRRAKLAGGRDQLRPVLHMVALAAIRSNPTIKAFAARLTAAGKPKPLILAACARKIIVILNAMLRDNAPWHTHAA